MRRIEKEYAYGVCQTYHNVGQLLEIEKWCKENYGEKEKWERRLPNKESKDKVEKRLGTALQTIRRKMKQKYEGKDISSIPNEVDREILEIMERLDREYNPEKARLDKAKSDRDLAKTKNEQAKELEEQVSEQLKERGQTHEEQ